MGITIAFDDPATVAAGVTVTLTLDGDGMCTSVDVLDVEFNSATAWVEDEEDGTPATLIENYAVALAARATGVCVVQITLTAGDSTANGDVTTDGADYVAGTWNSIFNTATGTDIKTNGNTLDLSAPNNYYTSSTETPDDTALDGNYRFNLWNGIWWSAADEDNTISIVTKMIHTGKLVLKPMKTKSTESSELVVLNSPLFFMMVLPTLLELLLLSTPLLLMKIMKTMLLFNLILTLSLINGPLMKTTLLVMPLPLMASLELLSNFWKLILTLLVLLTMMLVPW